MYVHFYDIQVCSTITVSIIRSSQYSKALRFPNRMEMRYLIYKKPFLPGTIFHPRLVPMACSLGTVLIAMVTSHAQDGSTHKSVECGLVMV